MDHSPGFLKIVADAKSRVQEITVEQARARFAQNPKAVLMDVREDSEWQTNGFRSVLTCDAAQKMDYRNVHSLAGGYKALIKAGWPMKSGG
jgi:rhodanese-related sulfurtransferase